MICSLNKNANQHTPVNPSNLAASYARFSSNLQRADSIVDQQRKCHEKASQNGHVIPPELEFKDEAVSGTKRDREGLNALEAAVKAGTVKTVYVHSLSRLSRETIITQVLIKDLVLNHEARIICVVEGIDTNDKAWKMNMCLNSMLSEQCLADLAENVFRGQEGVVMAGNAVGDQCFGYTTEPISSDGISQVGGAAASNGRNVRPKKRYVIHLENTAWVKLIFKWFTADRQSILWISKALNRLNAPKDHRARKGSKWHSQCVSRLLRNRKYIGDWSWGKQRNVRDPLTGKIRKKNRPTEETEKWVRHFPHLQIIDHETFAKAQQRLKENKEAYAGDGKQRGPKPGSHYSHPRHLLSQLLVCDQCGCTFNVSGAHGQYLSCPAHQRGACTCKTQLRRDLAERLILDAIGDQILANPAWREEVFSQTLKAWEALEAVVPSKLKTARQSLGKVEQKVSALLDLVESGQGGADLDERLALRRAEKQELQDQIKRLEDVERARPPKPTEAWIGEHLGKLDEVLLKGGPAAAYALRDLVGGKIIATESCHPASKRLHLRGRFKITTSAIVKRLVGDFDVDDQRAKPDSNEICEEFVLDFREEPPIIAQSEHAKKLYDRGMMNAQIAKELGCNRSYVTKLLKYWHESHGEEMLDGRARRASLDQKHLEPPLYQVIADEVMRLYREKVLLQEIADILKVDRNTITSAIKWWHESRGLPVPDGRTRRKELERKCSDHATAIG